MKGLAALCALSLAPVAVSGSTLRQQFAAANRLFWEQRYADAALAYESIEARGVEDADLEFNLGAAHAHAGRLGKAIAAFERARNLRPGDDDIEYNLAASRRALASRQAAHRGEAEVEGRRGPWTLLLGSLTADVAALSFAVPWALMFVLLVLRRWIAAPTARFAVGLTAALFGIGAAMSGVVFAGKLVGEHRAREGIVVVEEARVFGGPDERFQVSFTETEGERVRVIGREGRYLQVRTRDGREGWVLREDVDRL